MSLNVQRKDEGNHMSYFDDLNYLYSNRNTSQCSGEVIDSFLQKLNLFCAQWHDKATISQISDFMKLFYNDAPTEQNEFIYYLINNIVERFPETAIPKIVNNIADLEGSEGDECIFYLVSSISREEKYIKYCVEALKATTKKNQDLILDELKKNGNPNAISIVKEFTQAS